MENIDVGMIITVVLGLISAVATGFWLKAKGKLAELATLLRETVELVNKAFTIPQKAIAMLDDNTVTQQEIAELKELFQALRDEAADVKAAWRALWPTKMVS